MGATQRKRGVEGTAELDSPPLSVRPSLELPLGVIGASTGLSLILVAQHYFLIDDLPLEATALGGVAGVCLGGLLRTIAGPQSPPVPRTEEDEVQALVEAIKGRRPRKRWPWFLQMVLWALLAGAVAFTLSLRARWPLDDETLWTTTGASAVASLAAFPLGWWLYVRSERARRARRGSLVASADARSLWSVAAIAIALEMAIAMPFWAAMGDYGHSWPHRFSGLLAQGAALGAAVLITLRDREALRSAERLSAARHELETLSRDDVVPNAAQRRATYVDIGLGDDVYGQVEVAGSYRGAVRRVPAILGAPEAAVSALRRAHTVNLRTVAAIALLIGAALAVAL